MTALAYFLDKHFVLPNEGSFFSSQVIDSSTGEKDDERREI
jgi:hypothetical protein